MRLIASIVALIIATVMGVGSAANFVPHNCTTLSGLQEIGVQSQRVCETNNAAGVIFAALAIVFLVFAGLALSAHRRRKRSKRQAATT